MFSDNEAAVNLLSLAHVKLHKRYTALSFYCLKNAIVFNHFEFYFPQITDNPVDIPCGLLYTPNLSFVELVH